MAFFPDRTVPGSIVVTFREGVSEKQANDIAVLFGLNAVTWMDNLRLLVADVPPGTERDWIIRLKKNPWIITATSNGKIKEGRG